MCSSPPWSGLYPFSLLSPGCMPLLLGKGRVHRKMFTHWREPKVLICSGHGREVIREWRRQLAVSYQENLSLMKAIWAIWGIPSEYYNVSRVFTVVSSAVSQANICLTPASRHLARHAQPFIFFFTIQNRALQPNLVHMSAIILCCGAYFCRYIICIIFLLWFFVFHYFPLALASEYLPSLLADPAPTTTRPCDSRRVLDFWDHQPSLFDDKSRD